MNDREQEEWNLRRGCAKYTNNMRSRMRKEKALENIRHLSISTVHRPLP
jgi:hypothetical protein